VLGSKTVPHPHYNDRFVKKYFNYSVIHCYSTRSQSVQSNFLLHAGNLTMEKPYTCCKPVINRSSYLFKENFTLHCTITEQNWN